MYYTVYVLHCSGWLLSLKSTHVPEEGSANTASIYGMNCTEEVQLFQFFFFSIAVDSFDNGCSTLDWTVKKTSKK